MICFPFQSFSHGKKIRLWSGKVRLDSWLKTRVFPLHVTDKRVAEQKLTALVKRLEQEEAGIIAPKLLRDAAQTPIAGHLAAFLADLTANGRSRNTLGKYRNCIPKLCERCGWVMVRDINVQSFSEWSRKSGLSPKTRNCLLGAMGSLLRWMERRQLILANPLKQVEKVPNRSPGSYRRALSPTEAQKLLNVAPPHRAAVYLAALYTGLRRAELNGLKWEHFDLDAVPPTLRVPSSISKNRKESVHGLRPELVASLKASKTAHAKPSDWVFRGTVPRVPTFKKDLEKAGIPFEDEHGRRVDLHSLRTTFGTMLAVNGVSPRASMELMRHSDLKLTMKVYTDTSHLPLQQAMASLPSLNCGNRTTQLTAHAGVISGLSESPAVAPGRTSPLSQAPQPVALRRKKAARVAPGRLSEMEQAKRLELSTSTLARWCSTN